MNVKNNVIEFPMLELKAAWREGSQRLKKAGIAMPLLDSRLLLQHALEITYEELLADATRKLTQAEVETYAKLIVRRLQREPVSHIIGEKGFWKHVFYTNEHTLDPRPDSETLIDVVLKQRPLPDEAFRILDLGTGTGCLILSLLGEYKQAQGVAVDQSPEALRLAEQNARRLALQDRVQFNHGNWCEGLEGNRFDIVVSNPPYIPTATIDLLEPEVRHFDPHSALDGGGDGLEAYLDIAAGLKRVTHENALIVVEIGQGQEREVQQILEAAGLKVFLQQKDLSGVIRCLAAEWQR